METYLQEVLSLFRNVTVNSVGTKRAFLEALSARDIPRAIGMMDGHDEDVDRALLEYNPQTHDVMRRPDKPRKGDAPYRTEKLPRTRQRYINEVELFFLLGNDIQWAQKGGDKETYEAFLSFLESLHWGSRIRTAKRKAGAETEAALLYSLFRNDDGTMGVNLLVLARSTGYRLRTLFDHYGNMTAFAYGYRQKDSGKVAEYWDVQTAELLFHCYLGEQGWEVETSRNPTGKINAVYIRQPKAWDGAELRIRREEHLDSKIADTNNYFADPIATATADVISSMLDPTKPGKLIQLAGPNSSFSYVNPPQQSEIRRAEKEELEKSILFDTMTPDLSFDSLRGMGTLSGTAIRNSMILGYMKRARNIEIYEEMVARAKSVMLAVLRYSRPELEWRDFDVTFTFAEPFPDDMHEQRTEVSNLYGAGLMSLPTAVDRLDIVDDVEGEVDRITMEQMDKQAEATATEGEGQDQPADGKADEEAQGEDGAGAAKGEAKEGGSEQEPETDDQEEGEE